MRLWLMRLSRDDSAATAVEYAVLLALILVVVIVAIDSLGQYVLGDVGHRHQPHHHGCRWALERPLFRVSGKDWSVRLET